MREQFAHWRRPKSFSTPIEPRGDGSLRNFVLHVTPDLRLGKQLNCVRVTGSQETVTELLPLRTPEHARAVERYEKHLASRSLEDAAAFDEKDEPTANNPDE